MSTKSNDGEASTPPLNFATAPLAELPCNLRAKDFAIRAQVHRETVLRMIRRGDLKAVKLGRDYSIPKSEISRLGLE